MILPRAKSLERIFLWGGAKIIFRTHVGVKNIIVILEGVVASFNLELMIINDPFLKYPGVEYTSSVSQH